MADDRSTPEDPPPADEVAPRDLPDDYPAEWETHAVLSDGAPVELRPIRPSDRAMLDAFHNRQSKESIYFRYFQYRPKLSDRELDFFTQVDYRERMAFVALLGGEIVAIARYEKATDPARPEIAFFVDDSHHGRGLATLMLEYLAAVARNRGLVGFTATVLPANYAMLGVFRRAGFDVVTRFVDGLIEVEVDIALTAETSDVIAHRDSEARSRSVARLLSPSSVAVVGAGRQPGTIGHELLRHLLDGRFAGEIYPVNRNADEVAGRRAWASLTDIGKPVDLAVVAVPASEVEAVVADAIDAGVSGALIVSSGFSDLGLDGAKREHRLVDLARGNGMRLVGPNAFGMVNTDPDVRLRALFLPVGPRRGSVAVMSQSGPLGSAVLDHMTRKRVGISSFVAPGNRADVSVNDLLEYWLTDEQTTAVLLYVENFGNLRTFARLARDVSLTKPVVAVRPIEEGLEEMLSHSGVIVTDGMAGMADVARLIATQPLPKGRRVAIVSNSPSLARLTATACRRHGLDVVVPSSADYVDARVGVSAGTDPRRESVLVGDVDSTTSGTSSQPDEYERVLVATSVSYEVDAIVIAIVPTLEVQFAGLARLLARVDRSIDKPVLSVGLVDEDALRVPGLPVFNFPEEAARSLGRLARYAEWRRENGGPTLEERQTDAISRLRSDVRPVLVERLGDRPEVTIGISSTDIHRIVAVLDLPVAQWATVETADEAVEAAAEIGYPVVLKSGGGADRSVGEAGGAAIDLHEPGQVTASFARMHEALGAEMLPAIVQEMVPSTGNIKVELVQDPTVGAYVSVGIGGSAGRMLAPVDRRFLPLSAGEEKAMVDVLAGSVSLSDHAAEFVTDLLVQLELLAAAVPEVARLTLNPIVGTGLRSAISDIELVLRPWLTDPLGEVRRL